MLKNNKGFTLVELACIVMILLVLASIVVPTFSKYLSNTSDERNAEMAQDIMNAAQVIFYSEYADGVMSDDGKCVIPGSNGVNYTYTDSNKYDCDVHNKPFANEFLKSFESLNNNILGNAVVLVLGRTDLYTDPECELYGPIKAYTVYMSIYQPFSKSRVCFLTNDGKDVTTSPIKRNTEDIINIGGVNKKIKVDYIFIDNEKIYIQYYGIKNGLSNSTALNNLKNIIFKNYN